MSFLIDLILIVKRELRVTVGKDWIEASEVNILILLYKSVFVPQRGGDFFREMLLGRALSFGSVVKAWRFPSTEWRRVFGVRCQYSGESRKPNPSKCSSCLGCRRDVSRRVIRGYQEDDVGDFM